VRNADENNRRSMKMGYLYTTREKYTPEQLEGMKRKYTPPELVCCAGSREIIDKEVVFVGIGSSYAKCHTGGRGRLYWVPQRCCFNQSGR
jgi:hypothetical protein